MKTKRFIAFVIAPLILAGGLTVFWWHNRTVHALHSQPRQHSDLTPLLLPPISDRILREAMAQPQPRDKRRVTARGWRVVAQRETPFSVEHWNKFDAEYGIKDKSSSPVLYMLQSAKYALDTTTFVAKEGMNSLQLTCRLGDLVASDPPLDQTDRPSSNPVMTVLSDAEFKTIATLHDSQTDTAFFGVKLVLRYGP